MKNTPAAKTAANSALACVMGDMDMVRPLGLAGLRCDVAFLGTNGLTLRHGLSTPDHEEAAVKRAMVNSARKVVVLADSSKIGTELLVSFAPAAAIDVLITDAGLPAGERDAFTAAGIEVVVA